MSNTCLICTLLAGTNVHRCQVQEFNLSLGTVNDKEHKVQYIKTICAVNEKCKRINKVHNLQSKEFNLFQRTSARYIHKDTVKDKDHKVQSIKTIYQTISKDGTFAETQCTIYQTIYQFYLYLRIVNEKCKRINKVQNCQSTRIQTISKNVCSVHS